MPLVALDNISLAFGAVPLFDHATFRIDRGERVSIVGRNGAGKSTLLRLVSGEQAPDTGMVTKEPGVRVARLEQDVPVATDRTVFEVVAEGLGGLSDLVADYHRTAVAVAETNSPRLLERLGGLQHDLEQLGGWHIEQRVELVLSRLSLPSDAPVNTLSGGWKRRVLLARALVVQPDVLLLDEPTNHLDLEAIVWLEGFVREYAGAVVLVTHDRVFLQRVATRIVEIDRGQLTSWPGDYAAFRRGKDAWLANDAVRQEKFEKRLAEEEAWLRQGVKARRTRDEGRVRALMAMRRERAARREEPGPGRLRIERATASGQMVLEADHVSKAFATRPVVRGFSARIMRGDRVGVIGPNGAGKTTLLRLLIGELMPDEGEVRRGANVEITYYDQQREQLDPEQRVFDAIGDGNDRVTIDGQSRHVNAYLRDFLFPLDRAQSPVKALSGGERNRVLLARLFARPANLLVLDEPTNDLDLETLELLEAQLVEWPGTLLLVTHDRAFLDTVVTGTFVFEGDRVREYVGGYEDWCRQRTTDAAEVQAGRSPGDGSAHTARRSAQQTASQTTTAPNQTTTAPKKLSYQERRELDAVPGRIEALEAEHRALGDRIAHQDFYKEPAAKIAEALEQVKHIERDLADLYARWEALESRNERS
jgi:ATP-binding cassette subfamily F protein uup